MYVHRVLPTLVGSGRQQPALNFFNQHSNYFNQHSPFPTNQYFLKLYNVHYIHAPLMEKWPPLRISWQNPAYMKSTCTQVYVYAHTNTHTYQDLRCLKHNPVLPVDVIATQSLIRSLLVLIWAMATPPVHLCTIPAPYPQRSLAVHTTRLNIPHFTGRGAGLSPDLTPT